MSSLLQSPGRVSNKGAEIFLYKVRMTYPYKSMPTVGKPEEVEFQVVKRPTGEYEVEPLLYRIWRKPVGMFGCWVVFRINGTEQVPDLSVPTRLEKIPRDAERLTWEEASKYWFSINS